MSLGGSDISSVYVHSAICEYLFDVMVFHRCIINWSWGVDVSSVYVHSAICETYLV